jgi:flagellar biosynthesis protein FlhB
VSDTSERPFEATPSRIRKARREGNVARSSELGANFAFAGGALALFAVMPKLAATAYNVTTMAMSTHGAGSLAPFATLALVPIAASAVAGTFGSLLQNGGFHLVAIGPKAERLNPIAGLKRMVSRETLAHSARAALAFTCATAAMAPFAGWCAVALMRAPPLAAVVAEAWSSAQHAVLAASAVGFGFAFAEYGAARAAWLRKLRMSFDERKREVKEEEGDASARARRRALHRSFLRGGKRRLKDASFVVVNPHHVAVALEYRPPRVAVPRVLVRAADAAAAVLRASAVRYAVPIVENVWLARALYRDGRAGEPIPHPLYVAVAEIVVALSRTKGGEPS